MATCTYTTRNGQLTFQFAFADAKDLFSQRMMVELHDEEKCGLCGCPNIHCDIHKVDDFTYYRMKCQNRACNARLDFGQKKDGISLFVKREKNPETNGWYVYEGSDNDQEEPTKQTTRVAPAATTRTAAPATPAPAAAAPAGPPPPTDFGPAHKQALNAIRQAHTSADLARWWQHAMTLPATEAQHRDLEHAHDEALSRISINEAPITRRRPAPSRVA